ncbi:MAG: hypothetical protein IPK57_06725 [Chitinophagaceae bacterium]|nr:hypothetical protein [Chitinophagaceae bacterium]
MDTNQPATSASSTPAPAAPGLFGTKIPSSVSFAVGVLLFFMPFLDIKCNNMSLQKISGIELATGFHIKSPGGNNSLMGNFENNTGNKAENKGDKKDPNMFALAALVLGIGGFVVSLLNHRAGGFGGMLTGALSAAAMIGLMMDIKSDIKKELLGGKDGVTIAVEFTPWFYIAIIAFLAAAFFCYKRIQSTKNLNTLQ